MRGCRFVVRHRREKLFEAAAHDRQGVAALEFAILCIPYFLLVLGVCEVSFDMFLQEATDLALQAGARQMETGSGLNSSSETSFVKNYVCNSTAGKMLICNNFHIKVQILGSSDDYSSADVSTGTLPMNGNNLDLSSYDGTSAFCTAPPRSMILISAVYVGPTFLSAMLPFKFNEVYNGTNVHAVLSQVGVASEQFRTSQAGAGAAPQC